MIGSCGDLQRLLISSGSTSIFWPIPRRELGGGAEATTAGHDLRVCVEVSSLCISVD